MVTVGNSMWKVALPELETRRLRLRQVCRTDALAVFRIFSEPDLSMYDGIERHRSISDSIEFIDFRAGGGSKHSSVVLLVLEDRVLKTVVGVCEVSALTGARTVVQIAFITDGRHRRTGYMKEALTTLLEFLSNTCSSMVIEASVDLKNVACCRLLEGLGLREDLSRREVMTWMGEQRSVGVFEFLAFPMPAEGCHQVPTGPRTVAPAWPQ
jgi:ribosomal-protein-alanine N-acetyltransferase